MRRDENQPVRCAWAHARGTGEADVRYHDEEWGVPSRDERHLFEMIVLEGAQAGLSWSTILRKREGYRRAFARFDIRAVAGFDEPDVRRLLADPGIVRHEGKVRAAINNARSTLHVIERWGSLDEYLWRFVDGKPIVNRWAREQAVPTSTEISESMSRALKSDGFAFVGPTTCYAFMQAVGMVNDHSADCFRWEACGGER